MKPLLILLTFLIWSSSFAAVVTFSEFEKDLNNFEHLNFGVDALLNKGRQVRKIVDGLFDITRIYNISSELDYYDFIIQLDDGKESVIQATLRVQVEGDQATNVMSFSYTVTNTASGTTETGTDADVPETPAVEIPNEETEVSIPVQIPNEETAIVVEAPFGASPNEETDIGTETLPVEIPNEETVIIIPVEIPNEETEISVPVEIPNEETDIFIETPPVEIPNEETDITIETPPVEETNTGVIETTPAVTDSGVGSQTFGLDSDVQEALNYGVQSVIQVGNNNGKIPTGEDYQITQVNSWNKSPGNNRDNYSFDVEVTNSQGNIVIQMTFTVRKTSDGQMSVISFNYTVRKTTTTTRTNEVPQTPTASTTTTSSTSSQDADVQEALNFGVQSVLQTGYNSGKIPTGENYQVTQVNSVNRSSGNNRENYAFDVEVANSQGNIEIQMTFTVRKTSDGQMSVAAFNYNVRRTTTTTRTITRNTN